MRKIYIIFASFLFILFLVSTSNALILQHDLDASFPTKPDPDGASPWLTAIFDDENDPNGVLLTLTANLSGSNFVSDWYFNLDPALDPTNLSFSEQPGATAPSATISTGANSYKADGDGFFDILMVFPSSNSSPRFDNSDSITYLITSSVAGLDAGDFSFISQQGGGELTWYTAAHIQSISTVPPGSTFIGDGDGPAPVPEPSTMIISSLFLLGAGFYVRKKLHKNA